MPADIPPDIWNEIRKKLESWPDKDLVKAIASDKFSDVYRRLFEHAQRAGEAEKARLRKLTRQQLVERCLALVEKNHTFCAFVDQGGYSCVYFAEDTRNKADTNDKPPKE
tara:strand:- start:25916 stop:26245 length:330 start_codon:yes stop_codon:yes gene_type:complete